MKKTSTKILFTLLLFSAAISSGLSDKKFAKEAGPGTIAGGIDYLLSCLATIERLEKSKYFKLLRQSVKDSRNLEILSLASAIRGDQFHDVFNVPQLGDSALASGAINTAGETIAEKTELSPAVIPSGIQTDFFTVSDKKFAKGAAVGMLAEVAVATLARVGGTAGIGAAAGAVVVGMDMGAKTGEIRGAAIGANVGAITGGTIGICIIGKRIDSVAGVVVLTGAGAATGAATTRKITKKFTLLRKITVPTLKERQQTK